MPLKSLLQKYWGYSSFRPLQEEIIQSVLDGRDTLALLPTGGGKSICYQVPALAREGICVVISPLIALMKDQVENLRRRGIQATAVYSGMYRDEITLQFDKCQFGDAKFLYLSPERLENRDVKMRLANMKVNLLAVDEAHCISQWGYDFRPHYLRIADIRAILPGIPVLALTATATEKVVDDIMDRLLFHKKNVIRSGFQRKNLTYFVFKEEDKNNRLLKIISRTKGAGIVYVRSRRKTAEIAEFLNKNKIVATFYHGGLKTADRSMRQDSWMKNITPVMVATNAFGMGIDKPDVRFVVHMDLPENLEAYYQEAGRAGRDEKPSYCVILYQEADLQMLQRNTLASFPEPAEIKKIYQLLGNFCQIPVGSGQDLTLDFDIRAFAEKYQLPMIQVFNSIRFLEKEGYLTYGEDREPGSKLHFRVDKKRLYEIQVQNIYFDPFIKTLLRSYSGLFSDFITIRETEIARRSNLSVDLVIKYLNQLHSMEVVTYIPITDQPKITWNRERLEDDQILISKENYIHRKNVVTQKAEDVADYVQQSVRCRNTFLLAYFGELDAPRCGNCDVCLKRNKIGLSDLEFKNLSTLVIGSVSAGKNTLEILVNHLNQYPEKEVIAVVNWMLDNGKLIILPDGMLEILK